MAFDFGQIAQVFQGISLANEGADIAVAGAKYNSELYQMAANTSIEAAQYNQQIEKLNLDRQMDALSRETTKLFSRNQSTWANTGFSMASKSYLAVQSSAEAQIGRQVKQMRATSKQRMEEIMYEGRVAQVRYLNEAKNAEYQGQLASYQADQATSKSIGGLINNAFSSFFGG